MTEFTRVTEETLERAENYVAGEKLAMGHPGCRNTAYINAAQAALEAGVNGRITLAQHYFLVLSDAALFELTKEAQVSAESQMRYLPIQHESTPCVLRAFAMIQTHNFVAARAQFEEAMGKALESTEAKPLSDESVRDSLRIAARIEVEQERARAVRLRKEASDYLYLDQVAA